MRAALRLRDGARAPIRRMLLLAAFGVGIAFGGCAPPGGPGMAPRETRTRDILERARARVDTIRTVEVSGRVSVRQGGTRFDAKHHILFERPERYRIDLESKPFLGLFEASLSAFAEGDSLVVYSPNYGFVLEAAGQEDLSLLGPELGWVALPDVRGIMLGLPDFSGAEPVYARVRPGKDATYEIPLVRTEGTQIVWFAPETLWIEKMEIRNDTGVLLAAAEFHYASEESLFPDRVKIKCPESDAVILLTYGEFRVNGDVGASAFVLDIPANARRFKPNR